VLCADGREHERVAPATAAAGATLGKIIELARAGERDPTRLFDETLRYFGLQAGGDGG
jgi:hypothetical protein